MNVHKRAIKTLLWANLLMAVVTIAMVAWHHGPEWVRFAMVATGFESVLYFVCWAMHKSENPKQGDVNPGETP